MEIQKIKAKLKDRLTRGIDIGIGSIEELLDPASNLYNQFIIIKSRHSEIKRNYHTGTFQYDQFEVAHNRILMDLLTLVDSISNEDTKQSELPKAEDNDPSTRRANFFRLMEIFGEVLEGISFSQTVQHNSTVGGQFESHQQTVTFNGRQAMQKIYNIHLNYELAKEEKVLENLHRFFKSDNYLLEVYFQMVKHILQYINEDELDVVFLTNSFRALLSRLELRMIFYYAISGFDPGFKETVQASELFDESFKAELHQESHWNHY